MTGETAESIMSEHDGSHPLTTFELEQFTNAGTVSANQIHDAAIASDEMWLVVTARKQR